MRIIAFRHQEAPTLTGGEMTRRIQILCFACGLLLFVGATVGYAKIVFCVADDIYVMNDDGSGIRRLTSNTRSMDRYPRWAPDGKRIAFHRYMDKERMQTSSELFIMNADGTHLKRLTHNTIADIYPSWSPDGQSLAFGSRRSGNGEVYVIELASQTTKRLTGAEGELSSTVPDWSPDGTLIAHERFISNGPGLAHKNIYLMSANGEQQRPILLPDPKEGVPTVIMRFFPRWSSDGKRILFSEIQWGVDEQTDHLAVMRIGGLKTEIKAIKARLGDDNWMINGADWMDNDHAIIFSLRETDKLNASNDLYRYVFETRHLRRLTRDARDVRFPDWIEGSLSVSPQGKLPTQWGNIKHSLTGGDMP